MRGASWKRPGSGAMIASPFEESVDPIEFGRWSSYARRGRKKLAEGRMPPAWVVLFGLFACGNVLIFGGGDEDAGICIASFSLSPPLSLSPPIGRVRFGCIPL